MARTDTLGNFLTDVADAIREKKGTSETIVASDFDTEIASIPSGDNEKPQENDVIFIDYDGEILYSYTKEEFLQLNIMPSNPEHETLIAQGWNWDLEEAQDYVSKYGVLCIGQMYVTKGGTTNIYITLPKYRTSPYLGFIVTGTASVDWGDGSTPQTFTGTNSEQNIKHDYASPGDYVIKISTTEGSTIEFNGKMSYGGTFLLWGRYYNTYAENALYRNCVKKIELGSHVVYTKASNFERIWGLESVVISKSTLTTAYIDFKNCLNLKAVVLPNNLKDITLNCTYNSKNNYCSIPNSIETMGAVFSFAYSGLKILTIPTKIINMPSGDGGFRNANYLKTIIIPDNVETIGQNAFNSSKFEKIYLSANLVTIGASAFANNDMINIIKIPKGITSIPTSLFNNDVGLAYITFLDHEVVPSLGGNALANTGGRLIVVPDALYEDWKADSAWTSWASIIIKASDWVE